MCFKTVSPGGNTYLHPSLLLLLLHGIMGPFRFVLLNRKVAPECSTVDINTDIQRLCVGEDRLISVLVKEESIIKLTLFICININ
jgi:hypothetical protein